MTLQDEEFIKRLRETFKVEADEHLHAISTMLLELEKSPSSPQSLTTIESVYREAHSLKGAARAVDLADIEAICQSLESVFSSWKRQLASPSPEAFDALHQSLDKIRSLLGSPSPTDAEQQRPEELAQLLHEIEPQASATPPTQSDPPAKAPPPQPPTVHSAPHPPADSDKAAAQTVRISIAKLDARLLEAEDMLTVKATVAQRARELREIVSLFEQWRKEWSKVSSEARTLGKSLKHDDNATLPTQAATAASAGLLNFLDWNSDYLRSLESKLTTLASQAEQDRHNVGKRVDDLLEDSKKLLMLPFSTLAGIFPKLVRDLCRDQDKDAELVIRGGEVEIDKRILEEMKDALIHILRNSIDHGVEKPAERLVQKKPARATITLAAAPVNGNKVEILVSDDGAGVDVERVKNSAIRHGVISEAEARSLPKSDGLALVFHSEVSASPIVTAISGRGLGMAIVRAKTEKLGGQVSIESDRHVGTSLRMVLPLTLATFRGILVTAADRTFVIPTVNVERVLRIKAQDIQTAENREIISVQGRPVSLARLLDVLELPREPIQSDASASLPVVILHSADQRVAFIVNQVLHEEEVLVKPLRKPLVRVRNIIGATVLGSGRVVPILNVPDLIRSCRTHAAPPSVTAAPTTQRPAPKQTVLIVEDSVTSRMLLKGILESAGYRVRTAVDGVEAFTTLREDQFDLVVSDVEMPRMNGFDLTSSIRADKRLAELPVVLVTALESREERERGIDAGADAYIIKSSFDQSNLLEVVRRLI